MKLKTILALVLTIILLVFARKTSMVRSVYMEAEKGKVKIEHYTVPKKEGAGDAVIPVNIKGIENQENRVLLLYRFKKKESGTLTDYFSTSMIPDQKNVAGFKGIIPHQPKGDLTFYYIKVVDENGQTTLTLPRTKNSKVKPIRLRFEGEVPGTVLLPHILAMFGGVFFAFLSFFSIFELKGKKITLQRSVNLSRMTLGILFLGTFPLGWALNWYAFGVLWEAFPFGKDITDNKTQIVFLFWLLTLIFVKGSFLSGDSRKNILGEKTYFWMVFASFLVTILMYLVPHSL
ncbi:MAG: hypothetical protein AMJ90_02735 [candidate division Zixibacteria bacterium SM23_73_2]|nr:MAG: hypothetical protein AMJ90_02735 [candidate division Zixibacteria bacterium SM23_73_2]